MTAPRFDNTIGWNHIIYFIGIIFAAAIFYGSSIASEGKVEKHTAKIEELEKKVSQHETDKEVLKVELRSINEKLEDIKDVLKQNRK